MFVVVAVALVVLDIREMEMEKLTKMESHKAKIIK
jgi:hypothetical protein